MTVRSGAEKTDSPKTTSRIWSVVAVLTLIGVWLLIFVFDFVIFRVFDNPLFKVILTISYLTQSFFFVLTPIVIGAFISYRKFLRGVWATVTALYFSMEVLLGYYALSREMTFDFYYFWFNRAEAYDTLSATYSWLPARIALCVLLVIIFAVALYRFFGVLGQRAQRSSASIRLLISIALLLGSTALLTPMHKMIQDARTTYQINQFSAYKDLFLRSLTVTPPEIPATLQSNNSIILLHLESVNYEFVGPEITPNFYALLKEGVLFLRHHSTAIQTNRAEEVILCGSLPSINPSDVQATYQNPADEASRTGVTLHCLPEILKQAGYVTLFFKSHSLDFQRAGDFGKMAGFDEVHDSHDLMKPDDPMLTWGAREDAYYQRVVEYIQKNFADKKVFAYIAVSSTNHFPFRLKAELTPPDLFAALPYPDQGDYLKRRKNALFIQDAYTKVFFDTYAQMRTFNDTDVFIYGDHPVAVSQGSNANFSYNIEGVDENNFLTSLVFVPALNHRNNFATGRMVADDVGTSHLGLAPTILELLGIVNPYVGTPFLDRLQHEDQKPATCTVNMQPYTGLAVALVQYPHKIILNIFDGNIAYANLATGGERTQIIAHSLSAAEDYLGACLASRLGDEVGRDSYYKPNN